MNLTDAILLLAGSFFVIRGIFKGFSGEALSLVGVLGGFYCALRFYASVSGALSENFGVSPSVADMASMAGVFGVIFTGCSLVDRWLKKMLTKTNLTWMDKTFGAVTGFLKVYVIALLLLVSGMLLAPVAGDAWVRESRVLIATARTWPIVYPILDRAGMLPDLAELQQDAKEYVLEQASRSLFPDEADGASDAPDGAVSGDEPRGPVNSASDKEQGVLDYLMRWGGSRN
ncbi:MAG: CvpA family protein [Synergistaceae bacterium]|jgi:uncharacterized membrane protein required for colicin V production|nr:CvpA family protein [Synergistaceae bacterium]